MTQVKLISHNDYEKFETEVNEFLKGITLKGIKYDVKQDIIDGEPHYYYSVLIIYSK